MDERNAPDAFRYVPTEDDSTVDDSSVEESTVDGPTQCGAVVNLPVEFTLENVVKLSEADEFHRYELSEGTLIVMSPPPNGHQKIATRLIVWLASHGVSVDRVLSPAGVQTNERSGRIPDLIVMKGHPPDETYWNEPADVLLVVEILSPSTRASDLRVKPDEYAEAGIPHYWIVEPRTEPATVDMYELRDQPTYVQRETIPLDELLAGPVPTLD